MIGEKFVKKYMRLAKQVGTDKNPCYSRQIGVIIVDPIINKVVGTGYNGPPRKTFHCDHPTYLESILWPQLTDEEKEYCNKEYNCNNESKFARKFGNQKQCPRRILNIPSGHKLHYCSCAHAEANAIVNAAQNIYGSYAFCWCGVPCIECTKLMINAGIKRVYCLSGNPNYGGCSSPKSLFQQAGVDVRELDEEYCNEET